MRAWVRDCLTAWLTAAVLALVAILVAPYVIPLVVPMSRYYELRSVTVEDTTAGVSPKLFIDRTIHRDFRGRLEVEIMKAEGSEFVVWWECGPHVSEWMTIRDEAVLPEALDLDRWLGIPPHRPCPLPAGTYKIVTTVQAKGPLGAELSTTTDSPAFVVR